MNLGWGMNRDHVHHPGWGLEPPPPPLPPSRRRPADSVLAHRRVRRRRVFQTLSEKYESLKEQERDMDSAGSVGWYVLPDFKNTTQITKLSFYFRTILRTCWLHPRKKHQAIPPEIVELICDFADDYIYEPITVARGRVQPTCRHMIPRQPQEEPAHGLYSDIEVFFQM